MSKNIDYNTAGRRRRRRHPVRKLLLFLVLAAFILTGYARFIEPYLLTTTHEDYSAPALTGPLVDESNGLRIVLFADTHFSEYYTPENFQEVIEKINSEQADIVFFAGDLVDDLRSYNGDISDISAGLAQIEAKFGKFAVYGNHDYGGGMQFSYPDIMQAGGFKLLVNQSTILSELNVCILGIDDVLIGYGDPSYAAQLDDQYCNIILCHEPDVFDQMSDYSIDFMLSGHTHGRQINLKIFSDALQPALGRNYIKGSYEFSNPRSSTLYVTSGIGMTKLPLRLGAFPEVNVLSLHPADQVLNK